MVSQSRPKLVAEEEVVTGGNDGVDRAHAGRAVVGMKLVQAPRIVGHDQAWPQLPDGQAELLAQPHARLDLAVQPAQKVDVRHTQPPRRLTLLAFASGSQLDWIDLKVMAALVAAGDDQVRDVAALGGPAGDGAASAELGIVRMRRYHQDAERLVHSRA